MHRERVDSSSLASVGYDGRSHTLEVQFRNGGVYQYLEVPEDEVRGFLTSESLGRYLNENIKESYPCRKLG
jgi:hypothetical protein